MNDRTFKTNPLPNRVSIKTAPRLPPRPPRGAVPSKGYTITDRATGLEFWACVKGSPQWNPEGKGWVFEHYHSAYFAKFDLENAGYEVFVSKVLGTKY